MKKIIITSVILILFSILIIFIIDNNKKISKNKNEVFETSEDNLNFCLSKKSFISSFKE